MRTDYKICPRCGASLDIGEKCDCEIETSAQKGAQMPLNDIKPIHLPLKDNKRNTGQNLRSKLYTY